MYTSPHPRPWQAPRPSSSSSSRQKRGVGSSAFLCSCSKSGGGSRGGQAVKLAGRNHDMKRRCGIATSWRPALDTNCADHPRREIRFQVGTLTGWEGCTEAGCRDGSRRRGTWRRRLLLDGKAAPRRKRPGVRCICVASLMYAQKTVCRCIFLTLNSAGCGRGLVGCLKPGVANESCFYQISFSLVCCCCESIFSSLIFPLVIRCTGKYAIANVQ